jgi:hypothetical protein
VFQPNPTLKHLFNSTTYKKTYRLPTHPTKNLHNVINYIGHADFYVVYLGFCVGYACLMYVGYVEFYEYWVGLRGCFNRIKFLNTFLTQLPKKCALQIQPTYHLHIVQKTYRATA